MRNGVKRIGDIPVNSSEEIIAPRIQFQNLGLQKIIWDSRVNDEKFLEKAGFEISILAGEGKGKIVTKV